ncbi:hypothetical protein L195_g054766 [Trifolium pratense]|uniref:Chromo domain-containing protein n=1 Tax=Trifolium pratense TaxID=57577 RepID=A0A2K3KHX2_TRIPR|nr:hypothetical protein L195_g054766 [Trifolium pratense]
MCLKPFKVTTQEQYLPLPLTMSEIGPIIQPKAILDARTTVSGSQKVHQILIQWDQTTPAEAIWEDFDDLHNKFPTLNLEDKVVFNGERIVMKPNITNLLEYDESAKSQGDPQNLQENNSVSSGKEKIRPRVSKRVKKAHSRWEEFVKG